MNKRQRFRCRRRCFAGVLVLPLLAAGNVFAPVAAAPVAQTTAARKPPPPAPAGALLVVRGTVKALTRPPRPGSVPYKDALVSLHLVGAKAVRGGRVNLPGRAGGLLVYVWGMRNNKLTPAAYLRPGQMVTLALRPWEAVEEKYDGYNRREFDNDDLLVLPTFWGEPASVAAARP